MLTGSSSSSLRPGAPERRRMATIRRGSEGMGGGGKGRGLDKVSRYYKQITTDYKSR